jgi:carbamoyl-phosphate synthase large subunit
VPKRTDIESILILGSGPIIIGQACEFDYSGTQAVRALKEEGYRVILVNSNPATIMTDPELADRTYIEPLTPSWVERVIQAEKPDALLPTMGGQTALNLAMELHRRGFLEEHGVELIGANARSIQMAENREEFTEAMHRIGLAVPPGGFARSMDDAMAIVEDTGYPAIIRPSFTLGGTGGGIAYNLEEFESQVRKGLDASPITEVLIDRSLIGWKEYELEVVRDGADNVIIVCAIENFDPMGVHTGDSITVAPAQQGDRCGGGRMQHPVHREPRGWGGSGGRDEPPGVPLLGSGLQSHGLSHRQGGSETGSGLSPGRAPQRHHQDHTRVF